MGFFDDLKKEISQAVTELVSDEEMLQEESNYDAEEKRKILEESKEPEYFDEDDYIETEEDYADNTRQNMGVVIDDFASDEYVNTLDIDIKELIASYSSELGGNMQSNPDMYDSGNGEMQYESAGRDMDRQYDNTYENTSEVMNTFGFSNDVAGFYNDDDVMVNTLDDNLPVEETAEPEVFADEKYETENTTAEETIPEEVFEEETVPEEIIEEETVPEETIEEESVPEEPDEVQPEPEVSEAEEPVPEKTVTEEIVPKEPDEVQPEPEVSEAEEPELEKSVTEETIIKEADKITEEEDIEEPVIILKSQPKEKKVEEIKEEMKEEILKPMANETDEKHESADYSDETAVITKGLTVKGDLVAEGSINVFGEVEGNITCKGKLMVSGTVYGNAEAGELFANSAHITGNIVSKGSVKVGQGSIIIGNVTGSSAVIAGAVKGDIDVKGPVVVDATAIVMGDIKSKSVQINIGAAIEGRCSQCYADVSPTAFFKEN